MEYACNDTLILIDELISTFHSLEQLEVYLNYVAR